MSDLSRQLDLIARVMSTVREQAERYEATRPMTAEDIRLAKMRRARGLPYDSRALAD